MIKENYYQVFENDKPLEQYKFNSKKEARLSLHILSNVLINHSQDLGYQAHNTTHPLLQRSFIILKKTYANGHSETLRYTIKNVEVKQYYSIK